MQNQTGHLPTHIEYVPDQPVDCDAILTDEAC